MADQITTSLAQAKVLVMEGQKGADGKSPYIGANGNWFVWNGTAWVDTGIPASLDDAQIAAAVEEYLEEHPVEITVDDALSDTSENPVQNKVVDAALNQKGTYSKPSGGIPKSDLAQSVQDALDNADDAYQKPSGGIPKTDLASDVQTSLGKADSAYQKPSTGIPASDLAQAVQDELDAIEPFEITITQSGQTYSFSATAAEIAANADNCVLVMGDVKHKPSYVEHGSTWTRIYWIDGTTTLTIYELSTNGTNTTLLASYDPVPDELPAVTASDNGKFLRVVSGAWAAATVPSAESNSFGGGA